MDSSRNNNDRANNNNNNNRRTNPTSTTSLGKRRSLRSKRKRQLQHSPASPDQQQQQQQSPTSSAQQGGNSNKRPTSPNNNNSNNNHNNNNNNSREQKLGRKAAAAASSPTTKKTKTTAAAATTTANGKVGPDQESLDSTMSNPKSSEYGSQASPMRVPVASYTGAPVKVAILGAAGGIGQPLALLLMLHSEYVQHLALYDLVHVKGIAADLAHVDRQCKVTAHLGADELQEAVRGAKVIVIPAGLAQKPGMSRDDLFGSNATILFNLAKVCAQVAPEAHLAIISNPVNSLVPLVCEVYHKYLTANKQSDLVHPQVNSDPPQQLQQQQSPAKSSESPQATSTSPTNSQKTAFADCCRRIFGVTTLDVVRASTLTARSGFYKLEANGMFKDPSKITVPVVGGHAGRTIMPLLSQAQPKLDKRRLTEDRNTTLTLVESIQQAGIDVLNAKKGAGSATLAMAYAACRFTISLLRAQQGEQNIVEYAYVKHQQPIIGELDYFATPLILGKDGYTKALTSFIQEGKLLPYETQMIEEGAKELLTSVAKGEDFAKEHMSGPAHAR